MLLRLLVIEKARAEDPVVQHNDRKSFPVHDIDTTTTKQGESSSLPAQKSVLDDCASLRSAILGTDDHGTVTNVKSWRDHLWPLRTLLLSPRLATDLFGCLVQATLFTSIESILPL